MKIALPVQPGLTTVHWFLRGCLLTFFGLLNAMALAQAPLTLPFFDDFSTGSPPPGRPGFVEPNLARWQPGSGVYINNTLGINQPTAGLASFDGLGANGRPYTLNDQFAQGYTDTLASRPITLAGLSARDGVYLSFYWQVKGLGELPDPGILQIQAPDTLRVPPGTPLRKGDRYYPGDPTRIIHIDTLVVQEADSLTLQFQDAAGVWKTVWAKTGELADTTFKQAFVQVPAAYLHASFAFRFRTFGRRSGPFDTWNVDYVYLNRGRSATDTYVKDVAVRQALSPLLKRYTAMPLTQYLVNPSAETVDSVRTDINNLFNNFNFTTFRFTVRDEVSGRVIQDASQTNSVLIPSLGSQRKSVKPTPATGFNGASRAELRYKFDLLTSDEQSPSIPGVNLRLNDTLSAVATLADYYAYDDGSWEYALQVGPRERWAVRFVVNKPDVVTGIRACIVPIRTNQTGQPFVISVYNNRNSRPGQAIYQKSFTTQYPTYRNGFVDFSFDRSVSVTDTFYVGYQQITTSDTTQFRLGFDKNSPFGNQIFFNGGGNWEQNLQNPNSPTLNSPGAFMLRPVMGGRPDTVVTALPEPVALLHAYPNPTSGLIRWDGARLTHLEVMSLSGRLLYELKPGRGQETVDLSYLPDGLYLLRLFDGQRVVVQKLIIQH